jgi:hypothetical protein
MGTRITLLMLAAGLCLPAGCLNTTAEPPSQESVGQSPTSMLAGTLWEGSVRDRGLIQGLEPLRVQGYGLVVGLGNRGSSRVPPSIRGQMLADMTRRGVGTGGLAEAGLTPEKLLDSKSTVVVLISGHIPAGAAKGDTFDLAVRAIAGEDKVDLRGGRLFDAELRVYRPGMAAPTVSSLPLAVGSGDVFVNPFSNAPQVGSDVRLDEGVILGGGRVTVRRDLSVILPTSSLRVATMIAKRINDRFLFNPPIAAGRSASKVDLDLGRFPLLRRQHMLSVIGGVYLEDSPGMRQRKTADLLAALRAAKDDGEAGEAALAIEGIGESALSQVRNLISDPSPRVRFYAARTASRLGDVAPTDLFGELAADSKSPYQDQAIEQLGQTTHDAKAVSVLRRLIGESRAGMRIAAYEALSELNKNAVAHRDVGGVLRLDIVPDEGEPMIYATVRGEARIAILGRDVRVVSPVFFDSQPLGLTLSETQNRDKLQLVRRVMDPFGDVRYSPPMDCSHVLADLIAVLAGKVAPDFDEEPGLGFKYGQVIGALYALCANRQVNATLHLQRTPLLALQLLLEEEQPPASEEPGLPPRTGPPEDALPPQPEGERIHREVQEHGP